ncbi:Single-stranded DNA-binding protein [Nymphaea thermarum]|nr:Single-stranded DNA-binding protein [Nymphaea thermarum]
MDEGTVVCECERGEASVGVLQERLYCSPLVGKVPFEKSYPLTYGLGFAIGLQRGPQLCYSTISYGEFEEAHTDLPNDDEELIPNKREIQPQGVDPKKGWNFRGVHRAIICGRLGQAPVQKILRNGRTVTIFTVGTGGMFDQRTIRSENMPRPVQWHRIVVHNEGIGAYAVQKLMKDSPVFVEGDIETRVYNDSINGLVKNVPEICIRRDGTNL